MVNSVDRVTRTVEEDKERIKSDLEQSPQDPDQVNQETLIGEEKELHSQIEDLQNTSHLAGLRLLCTTLGSLLALYLVNLEVTIVSTSLVSIANDFKAFEKASWVVTGYLITYTGFIIIWTKLSDIFGRKAAFLSTMIVFVAFSTGCATSQTMTQLIVCRAFQGVGAAGAYSMSILTVYEMVPKEKYGVYGAMCSASIAFATVTGPIFAGALNKSSTWRWVFYINLPPGVLALLLLGFGMPTGFGTSAVRPKQPRFSLGSIRRLDILGAALLLSGSLLLVTALTEATIEFTWQSAATIVLLTLSGISWVLFLVWEWFITKREREMEPIFPWRFIYNQPWVGILLTAFFTGSPYNVVAVSLPQRFQAVSGTSVLGAGIRLIPYSLTGALGSAIANIICTKFRIPLVYFFLLGAALNVTGMALLSTLPTSDRYPAAGYGYEVLGGFGVGATMGIIILGTPFVVEARDLAVATGAVIQFRFLAGAIGLSIASTVLNSMLQSELRSVLPAAQLDMLLQTTDIIRTLPPEIQRTVRDVFARAYNIQFKIMLGFSAAQFPASLLLLKRGNQLRAE